MSAKKRDAERDRTYNIVIWDLKDRVTRETYYSNVETQLNRLDYLIQKYALEIWSSGTRATPTPKQLREALRRYMSRSDAKSNGIDLFSRDPKEYLTTEQRIRYLRQPESADMETDSPAGVSEHTSVQTQLSEREAHSESAASFDIGAPKPVQRGRARPRKNIGRIQKIVETRPSSAAIPGRLSKAKGEEKRRLMDDDDSKRTSL